MCGGSIWETGSDKALSLTLNEVSGKGRLSRDLPLEDRSAMYGLVGALVELVESLAVQNNWRNMRSGSARERQAFARGLVIRSLIGALVLVVIGSFILGLVRGLAGN